VSWVGGLCRNSTLPGQAILSKILVDSCWLIFQAVDETTTKAQDNFRAEYLSSEEVRHFDIEMMLREL